MSASAASLDVEKAAVSLSANTSALSVSTTLPRKELPPLRFSARYKPKVTRAVSFRLWFNTYRKLFAFVLTFNVVGLILAITGTWQYPRVYTGAFVLGNLQVAVLVRNEFFGRLLYLLVNTLFAKWTPLRFRLACTSTLQHLGGIHSGCAVSGTLWLLFRLVRITANTDRYPASIIVSGLITFFTLAASFPWIRNSRHNIFEAGHRLIGWLSLISSKVFVVLGDCYDVSTRSWRAAHIGASFLVRQQDFWFAVVMSLLIVMPWVTLRKVPVVVEVPSPKVAIIRFQRGMQQGLLTRISRGSWLEFHAFGIISEGRNSGEHFLICGVQGDFTQSLVDHPPTYLWTRQLKCANLSNTTKLYKRGIRVCTGTGLGAALSTCLQSPDWHLIWMGSNQEATFGTTISSLIRDKLPPEQYTLWDSKVKGGRPVVMRLIRETYEKWGAEVVFITSNMQGNAEMMEGCMREGIPAFGTLWDF
ncbi:hypothetical protein FB45DRAFT_1101513 [Roridomyces roridus]|uniref:Non-ribosomal peptide synthetase n=1 Tax=Roridomyces roridus TaxID=1738132 RepID=A0AAD7CFW4_9AGAR|nr:hypothetical protein FB45DRAFT_1101513 [Roridomyces roridus]